MQQPSLDPPCADVAPTSPQLTGYDEAHLVTYLRLLDADADGADWCEAAHRTDGRDDGPTAIASS